MRGGGHLSSDSGLGVYPTIRLHYTRGTFGFSSLALVPFSCSSGLAFAAVCSFTYPTVHMRSSV